MAQEEKPQENSNRSDYSRWAGLGLEFCGVVGLFCYIGYKIDEKLKTSPWFMLAGFALGFIGMMYIIIKDAWKDRNKK
jgi:F0F1-type ATP synthase assembly protein I